MNTNLAEADLIRLWEQHTELEFSTKDAVRGPGGEGADRAHREGWIDDCRVMIVDF